ncbi:hypothetical protein BGZ60DRAFT_513385 [Tricladium varicosporioides]|nr:hypothetical protein BGZ60DRAFT_513385 [Hymenoscyphus varicosporioides]
MQSICYFLPLFFALLVALADCTNLFTYTASTSLADLSQGISLISNCTALGELVQAYTNSSTSDAFEVTHSLNADTYAIYTPPTSNFTFISETFTTSLSRQNITIKMPTSGSRVLGGSLDNRKNMRRGIKSSVKLGKKIVLEESEPDDEMEDKMGVSSPELSAVPPSGVEIVQQTQLHEQLTQNNSSVAARMSAADAINLIKQIPVKHKPVDPFLQRKPNPRKKLGDAPPLTNVTGLSPDFSFFPNATGSGGVASPSMSLTPATKRALLPTTDFSTAERNKFKSGDLIRLAAKKAPVMSLNDLMNATAGFLESTSPEKAEKKWESPGTSWKSSPRPLNLAALEPGITEPSKLKVVPAPDPDLELAPQKYAKATYPENNKAPSSTRNFTKYETPVRKSIDALGGKFMTPMGESNPDLYGLQSNLSDKELFSGRDSSPSPFGFSSLPSASNPIIVLAGNTSSTSSFGPPTPGLVSTGSPVVGKSLNANLFTIPDSTPFVSSDNFISAVARNASATNLVGILATDAPSHTDIPMCGSSSDANLPNALALPTLEFSANSTNIIAEDPLNTTLVASSIPPNSAPVNSTSVDPANIPLPPSKPRKSRKPKNSLKNNKGDTEDNREQNPRLAKRQWGASANPEPEPTQNFNNSGFLQNIPSTVSSRLDSSVSGAIFTSSQIASTTAPATGFGLGTGSASNSMVRNTEDTSNPLSSSGFRTTMDTGNTFVQNGYISSIPASPSFASSNFYSSPVNSKENGFSMLSGEAFGNTSNSLVESAQKAPIMPLNSTSSTGVAELLFNSSQSSFSTPGSQCFRTTSLSDSAIASNQGTPRTPATSSFGTPSGSMFTNAQSIASTTPASSISSNTSYSWGLPGGRFPSSASPSPLTSTTPAGSPTSTSTLPSPNTFNTFGISTGYFDRNGFTNANNQSTPTKISSTFGGSKYSKFNLESQVNLTIGRKSGSSGGIISPFGSVDTSSATNSTPPGKSLFDRISAPAGMRLDYDGTVMKITTSTPSPFVPPQNQNTFSTLSTPNYTSLYGSVTSQAQYLVTSSPPADNSHPFGSAPQTGPAPFVIALSSSKSGLFGASTQNISNSFSTTSTPRTTATPGFSTHTDGNTTISGFTDPRNTPTPSLFGTNSNAGSANTNGFAHDNQHQTESSPSTARAPQGQISDVMQNVQQTRIIPWAPLADSGAFDHILGYSGQVDGGGTILVHKERGMALAYRYGKDYHNLNTHMETSYLISQNDEGSSDVEMKDSPDSPSPFSAFGVDGRDKFNGGNLPPLNAALGSRVEINLFGSSALTNNITVAQQSFDIRNNSFRNLNIGNSQSPTTSLFSATNDGLGGYSIRQNNQGASLPEHINNRGNQMGGCPQNQAPIQQPQPVMNNGYSGQYINGQNFSFAPQQSHDSNGPGYQPYKSMFGKIPFSDFIDPPEANHNQYQSAVVRNPGGFLHQEGTLHSLQGQQGYGFIDEIDARAQGFLPEIEPQPSFYPTIRSQDSVHFTSPYGSTYPILPISPQPPYMHHSDRLDEFRGIHVYNNYNDKEAYEKRFPTKRRSGAKKSSKRQSWGNCGVCKPGAPKARSYLQAVKLRGNLGVAEQGYTVTAVDARARNQLLRGYPDHYDPVETHWTQAEAEMTTEEKVARYERLYMRHYPEAALPKSKLRKFGEFARTIFTSLKEVVSRWS